MHVLYIHQHFSTPQGKTGIRSYQMAKALIAEGHTVTMVCGSYGGGNTGLSDTFSGRKRQGVVEGINVIEFDLSYSNSDGFLKRAMTFLRFSLGASMIALRGNYDLIFSTTTPLTAGIPGIVGRWLRRKPFVFEVRDLWPELPRQMGVITNPIVLKAMSILEWTSYRSAHRCVALSPGIADGIARCGVNEAKIHTVPNGSDIDIFQGDSAGRWSPEGVADDDLLAIFAGTHGQANGLDAVLDAALELKKRGRNDIKLALVGDGKMKPALQARAKAVALDNVLFVDPVPKLQLIGLFQNADIGIQCLANVPAFYYGTSPNKFFDYIAAGLPVLNNYPGWLAGMISENQCGFSVPPDDPGAFADALEAAFSDKAALKKMGENSLKLARSEFDRTILAKKWVSWVTGGVK